MQDATSQVLVERPKQEKKKGAPTLVEKDTAGLLTRFQGASSTSLPWTLSGAREARAAAKRQPQECANRLNLDTPSTSDNISSTVSECKEPQSGVVIFRFLVFSS